MADLEQALDRILSDPEAMSQIMDLAGKLQSGAPAPEPSEDTSESPPRTAPPELEGLAPLFSLLRSGGSEPDSAAEALVRALGPYLSESRKRRLDRALRLASLARTARSALDLWKEGKLSV